MRKKDKILRICAHCSKEFLTHESVKIKYCCRECYFSASKGENWHSYNKELVPCSECGEGILMHQFKKNQSENHFCNKYCRKKWYEKNMSGSLHPIFKQIPVNCNNCNTEISIPPSELKHKHHFCNRKCFDEFSGKGMRKGENHSSWKGGDVEIECAYCHEHVMISQSKYNQSLKTNSNLFCNSTCMGKWRSDNFVGENSPSFGLKRSDETKLKHSIARKGKFLGPLNPAWKGGNSGDYPITFYDIRGMVRERDDHTCQMCGGKAIDVHHIDYNKKNNNIDNLVTLCSSCHASTNFYRYFWESHFRYRRQAV